MRLIDCTMHSNDHARALDILMKDLKVFAHGNEELFREMTQLLTFDDFRYMFYTSILISDFSNISMMLGELKDPSGFDREHELLSMYGDSESPRKILMDELKKLFEANPVFHGKLKFPSIKSQRLRRLINQG